MLSAAGYRYGPEIAWVLSAHWCRTGPKNVSHHKLSKFVGHACDILSCDGMVPDCLSICGLKRCFTSIVGDSRSLKLTCTSINTDNANYRAMNDLKSLYLLGRVE